MFIAMNRFQIGAGHEEAFEKRWRERNSRLSEVPGFEHFWLLRGEGGVFISMSQWESRGAFTAWTESAEFRAAHGQGGPPPPGMYQGAPQFSGYEVALSQAR
jgi:heme-degrading monooxygenase HmoA